MQSGDACHGSVTAVTDFLGLDGGDPAALLFIETLEEEIHLFVESSLRVVRPLEVVGTLALMKGAVVHDRSPRASAGIPPIQTLFCKA